MLNKTNNRHTIIIVEIFMILERALKKNRLVHHILNNLITNSSIKKYIINWQKNSKQSYHSHLPKIKKNTIITTANFTKKFKGNFLKNIVNLFNRRWNKPMIVSRVVLNQLIIQSTESCTRRKIKMPKKMKILFTSLMVNIIREANNKKLKMNNKNQWKKKNKQIINKVLVLMISGWITEKELRII